MVRPYETWCQPDKYWYKGNRPICIKQCDHKNWPEPTLTFHWSMSVFIQQYWSLITQLLWYFWIGALVCHKHSVPNNTYHVPKRHEYIKQTSLIQDFHVVLNQPLILSKDIDLYSINIQKEIRFQHECSWVPAARGHWTRQLRVRLSWVSLSSYK